ncbi:EamA family transporter [Paradesulfitobacterium aromaticivorans]
MLLGELLAIISGVCFSLSIMIAQRGMREASASAGVTIGLFFNNIVYGLFILVIFGKTGLPPIAPLGVLFAVIGGVFGNIIGRTLNYQAVRRIGSARAISFSLVQTLFSFFFSVLILRESLDFWSVFGMGLMVGGVYWLSVEQVKRESMSNLSPSGNIAGNKRMSLGVVFALFAGLAYSGADLTRKMSVLILPSAVLTSALGGLAALFLQIIIVSSRQGWGEIKTLKRTTLGQLAASGTIGGLAVFSLNSALSYAPVVIVNSLYNIRVWIPIILGPLLLGREGKVSRTVAASTLLILTGTLIIIIK